MSSYRKLSICNSFVSSHRFFRAAIRDYQRTACNSFRTALSAVVTDMKLMMHRDRSYIFRFLSDVMASVLGRDRGITSTLQQRHHRSIDLTPLHPISAVARIALVQEHTTGNFICMHLHKIPRELVSLLSFSLFSQANYYLHDTLRVCICVCVVLELSATWVKRRRM